MSFRQMVFQILDSYEAGLANHEDAEAARIGAITVKSVRRLIEGIPAAPSPIEMKRETDDD